jgi:uncharacterized protein (TIGR03382 family)
MDIRKVGIAMMGIAMLAGSARATTTYGTVAAFNAAVPSATTVNFETATVGANGFVDLNTGILFSDQNGGSSLLTVLTACPIPCVGTGELKVLSGFSLNVALPAATRSFALDIATFSAGAAVNITFDSAGHNSFIVTTNGTDTFFGVTATAAITNFTITGAPPIGIDNFQADGFQAATPDGPTMLLIGGGLIVLQLLRRRRAIVAD